MKVKEWVIVHAKPARPKDEEIVRGNSPVIRMHSYRHSYIRFMVVHAYFPRAFSRHRTCLFSLWLRRSGVRGLCRNVDGLKSTWTKDTKMSLNHHFRRRFLKNRLFVASLTPILFCVVCAYFLDRYASSSRLFGGIHHMWDVDIVDKNEVRMHIVSPIGTVAKFQM